MRISAWMQAFLLTLVIGCNSVYAQDIKITKEEPLTISAKKVSGNNKKKEITYTGNVMLEHAGNTLMAEKIIILSDNDKIVGEKEIKFFNKEKTFDIRGGFVEYYKSNKYILMKENPVLLTKDRENIETRVKGDKMQLYQEEEKAIIEGNVEIQREDIMITCELADYDRKEDKIILKGKPLVLKKLNSFEGNKIEMYVKKRLLIADSNVKAVIYPEEIKEGKK